jgi:hypothetical protein
VPKKWPDPTRKAFVRGSLREAKEGKKRKRVKKGNSCRVWEVGRNAGNDNNFNEKGSSKREGDLGSHPWKEEEEEEDFDRGESRNCQGRMTISDEQWSNENEWENGSIDQNGKKKPKKKMETQRSSKSHANAILGRWYKPRNKLKRQKEIR